MLAKVPDRIGRIGIFKFVFQQFSVDAQEIISARDLEPFGKAMYSMYRMLKQFGKMCFVVTFPTLTGSKMVFSGLTLKKPNLLLGMYE